MNLGFWAFGYLTQDIISTKLYEQLPQIQGCLSHLKATAQGGASIQFVVNGDGKISGVDISLEELDGEDFSQCIQSNLGSITFPTNPESLSIEWKLMVKEEVLFPLPPVILSKFEVQFPGLVYSRPSLDKILDYLDGKGEVQ